MKKKRSPEYNFIKDFITQLNQSEVSYCILRDYELLPDELDGHDIDILIPKHDVKPIFKIIKSVATLHGGRVISFYDQSSYIVRVIGKHSEWWGVAIDLFPQISNKGMAFYDSEAVLYNSTQWKNISVADRRDSAMISFLKEILANGKDRKGYSHEALKYYDNSAEYFNKILTKYFGESFIPKHGSFFKNKESDSKNIELFSKSAWAALRKTSMRKKIFNYLKVRLINTYKKYRRLIKPAGFCVAVIGSDGSGKSSLIKRMEPVLEKAMHNKIKYQHMRPNLLPSLAQIIGKPQKTTPITAPHTSRPSGFCGSLLRLMYYSLDYILGYWFKVYLDIARRPSIWVFDRYYYDYFFDQHRSRVELPTWIIKLFYFIIPKPNITLCLGTSPEKIYIRKPELPINELKRQLFELKRICRENPGAVWIDTGCSIDMSVDHALEAISKCMAKRYE